MRTFVCTISLLNYKPMKKFTSLKQGLLLALLFITGQAVAQTNLLSNGSFEEWTEGVPAGWKSASSASNATLTQSEEAKTGTYSVEVTGSTKGNQRLATAEMQLEAGTYTFSVWAKAATEEDARFALGYVPIKADGKPGGYAYNGGSSIVYVTVTNSEWTAADFTFTLAQDTTVCLFVANNKTLGKNLLVDDAVLVKQEEPGETPDEPGEPTVETVKFLDAPFSTSQSDFIIENKVMPEALTEIWKLTMSYGMAATGYKSSVNYEAESWLISPAVDLTKATKAVLTFDHAGNYFTNISEECSVWAAEAGTINWTKLTVATWPTNYTFVSSGEIDLSAYVGKSVQIAFRYTSTDEKAGTWDVKNVLIAGEGEAVAPIEPDEPEPTVPTEGEGTEDKPYTVADVIALASPATQAWVTGYIVGTLTGKTTADAEFGTENAVMSNLILADSLENLDMSACIPVQLPNGSLRTALNLVNHPGLLNKRIKLYASLENYFGVPGLKSASQYVLIDEEDPTEPDEPADPETEVRVYAPVTSIESGGRYVIAISQGDDFKVALPLSGAYGYLQVETATPNVYGELPQASESNEWEVTAVEGGYTIEDAQGRLLYMTGTYNSFNVSDAPEAGSIWTFEMQADSSFVITNVDKQKYIQYAPNYTSYGSYASAQDGAILPRLFAYSYKTTVGVENVKAEAGEAPVEVFTVNGCKVGNSLKGLRKGFYIVKQGNSSKKVLK